LPGDLYEKITPYLRPLHDALHDMLPAEEIQKHAGRGTIEIARWLICARDAKRSVYHFGRGAKFHDGADADVLTRLGHGSKAVITGDETQIDLAAA